MSAGSNWNDIGQPNCSSRSGRCGSFISGICVIKKVSVSVQRVLSIGETDSGFSR